MILMVITMMILMIIMMEKPYEYADSHTASSWLCHDHVVRSSPRSQSSVSAMDEAYTDDDNDDDTDDENDDEAI